MKINRVDIHSFRDDPRDNPDSWTIRLQAFTAPLGDPSSRGFERRFALDASNMPKNFQAVMSTIGLSLGELLRAKEEHIDNLKIENDPDATDPSVYNPGVSAVRYNSLSDYEDDVRSGSSEKAIKRFENGDGAPVETQEYVEAPFEVGYTIMKDIFKL